jgi:hypothetical protein
MLAFAVTTIIVIGHLPEVQDQSRVVTFVARVILP